jgi:hypothetical protein
LCWADVCVGRFAELVMVRDRVVEECAWLIGGGIGGLVGWS